MIKFNYILNDLALSSLITKCLYSENANYSDKEELENQIKLIQQESEQLQQEKKQLKEDIKNIINILNNNCDDLEATEEEFNSLDRLENENN